MPGTTSFDISAILKSALGSAVDTVSKEAGTVVGNNMDATATPGEQPWYQTWATKIASAFTSGFSSTPGGQQTIAETAKTTIIEKVQSWVTSPWFYAVIAGAGALVVLLILKKRRR